MSNHAKKKKSSPTLGTSKRAEAFGILATKAMRKGIGAGKHLPTIASEPKLRDAASPIAAAGLPETEKWDVTWENNSTSDGTHFAVANVGNNGRIYLRPSVRSTNRQHKPGASNLPVTPPGTSGFLGTERERGSPGKIATGGSAQISVPTATQAPRATAKKSLFPDVRGFGRPTRHQRALSDSTIHEASTLRGGFRDVDYSPGPTTPAPPIDGHRPRTMEDLNAALGPLLNINIPSWRIGTPRFTLQGTPMIRASSYAPTEDFRSSRASMFKRGMNDQHGVFGWIQGGGRLRDFPLEATPATSQPDGISPAQTERLLRAIPPSSGSVSIEPIMFNILTFKPACDDKAIVRYAPTGGAVIAATPPRLVAEITSPTFLDYELISDFFLTYRAFLTSDDLIRMLFARMRWALAREDETGMIVRVRTFVAIRHWVLNYFMDDFVLNYDLRALFCKLLNDVVDDLSEDPRIRKAQLNVLGELKKCWRRICSHYWDPPKSQEVLNGEAILMPGGIVGNRDPNLDPSYWKREGIQPPQMSPSLFSMPIDATTAGDTPKITQISDFVVFGNRPITPELRISGDRQTTVSDPASVATSPDVLSCSFPNKTATKNTSGKQPVHLNAHPVPFPVPATSHGTTAPAPRGLASKRSRPMHSHKRSNSMSDSLRDHWGDDRNKQDQEFLMPMPSIASLVRGNVLPPGQSFVDDPAEGYRTYDARQTTIFQTPSRAMILKERALAGAMSASGMKKLLKSVRKALASRVPITSPTQANFMRISPVDSRGMHSNRVPATAVVPQSNKTNQNGTRPAVRIDLLGAEVAEDFKLAVRGDQGIIDGIIDEDQTNSMSSKQDQMSIQIGYIHDTVPQPFSFVSQEPRPVSDTGITMGSRSIIIFDGTNSYQPPPLNVGPGRTMTPSLEAFADTFRMAGVDPTTPPNTPPAPYLRDTPRRSSYLLNHHVLNHPTSQDDPPPPVPKLPVVGTDQMSLFSEQSRPSQAIPRGSSRYQGDGTSSYHKHRRYGSSRTQQSLRSMMYRRYSSGILHSSALSYDAATESEASVFGDDESESAIPERLHVLRRRPGGDLKAARNVGDLQHHLLRKSQSVGSFATYTESMRSSFVGYGTERAGLTMEDDETTTILKPGIFSLGQLTKKPQQHDQHEPTPDGGGGTSSKPPMRPSFEMEAQRLAQISDDEDDGGIESALLKLEGRYDKKSKQTDGPSGNTDETEDVDIEKLGRALQEMAGPAPVYHFDAGNNNETVMNGDDNEFGRHDTTERPKTTEPVTQVKEVGSFLSDASPAVTPLLRPALEIDVSPKQTSRVWADRSVLKGFGDDDDSSNDGESDDNDDNFLLSPTVFDPNTPNRLKLLDDEPKATDSQTFLDDESISGSDLSSELSDADDTQRAPFNEAAYFSSPELPTHPLADPNPDVIIRAAPASLSTPRQTLSPSLEKQSHIDHVPKTMLPTPDATPTAPFVQTLQNQMLPADSRPMEMPRAAPQPPVGDKLRKYSVHLPFILAFDSDILAQQLTLIEKDALNEIDWKDLIDMNWKNAASSNSRSWVDFLRNTDAHGVEVVIARFNIMVKWAMSEIVLTQHIEERARCIIKMIHIAAHCRRYRNFATLAQLTIALTSNEISKLSKTWEMVPTHDMKTLETLEALITPTRNFYNLRAEMEVGTDIGCIPFVGIYTHDLLYNAQKPSEIASSLTTPPLVNFERCRVTASIVKVLLRLLEASTHYGFQPLEGITERCLWVGALSDEDIRRHLEALE